MRDWRIRRLSNGEFAATANDVVGTAFGSPSGRMLHRTWILATWPGNPSFDVTMDQRMYLADSGPVMSRTVISRFGMRLAEVSEHVVQEAVPMHGDQSPPATAATPILSSLND